PVAPSGKIDRHISNIDRTIFPTGDSVAIPGPAAFRHCESRFGATFGGITVGGRRHGPSRETGCGICAGIKYRSDFANFALADRRGEDYGRATSAIKRTPGAGECTRPIGVSRARSFDRDGIHTSWGRVRE